MVAGRSDWTTNASMIEMPLASILIPSLNEILCSHDSIFGLLISSMRFSPPSRKLGQRWPATMHLRYASTEP